MKKLPVKFDLEKEAAKIALSQRRIDIGGRQLVHDFVDSIVYLCAALARSEAAGKLDAFVDLLAERRLIDKSKLSRYRKIAQHAKKLKQDWRKLKPSEHLLYELGLAIENGTYEKCVAGQRDLTVAGVASARKEGDSTRGSNPKPQKAPGERIVFERLPSAEDGTEIVVRTLKEHHVATAFVSKAIISQTMSKHKAFYDQHHARIICR